MKLVVQPALAKDLVVVWLLEYDGQWSPLAEVVKNREAVEAILGFALPSGATFKIENWPWDRL